MSTSVLPLARTHWLFQLIGSSVAITAALLLGAAGVLGLANPLYVPLALVGLAMFGTVFLASVRALATDGLVLGEDGFTYSGRRYPWSQIATFTPVGLFGKSHVRIVFRPDAELSNGQRFAEQCGRFGFYHPATHIPIKGFRTGGEPLVGVLSGRLHNR